MQGPRPATIRPTGAMSIAMHTSLSPGRSAREVSLANARPPPRELEEENSRLKRIVADLSRDRAMLQDVIKRML